MEQQRLFKISEERFTEFVDRAELIGARLEDLYFRALRATDAAKKNRNFRDIMFHLDLLDLRGTIQSLSRDSASLADLIDWLEREGGRREERRQAAVQARSLLDLAERYRDALRSLNEQAKMLQLNSPAGEESGAAAMAEDLSALAASAGSYPSAISSRILDRLGAPGS